MINEQKKEKIREYILVMLGAPVSPIPLSEKDIEQAISFAIKNGKSITQIQEIAIQKAESILEAKE
jgi:hypothetical protein